MGTHPLIPLNIVKAIYLQPPPTSILSMTNLIAQRAIALQKHVEQVAELKSKVYEAHQTVALHFEKEHKHSIKDFNFKCGDLVLIRNTKIEKSLNSKMCPRYLGPLIVVLYNKGSTYIVCKLDSTVLNRPITAFQVISYFARQSIPIPDNLEDVSMEHLRKLERSNSLGDNDNDILEDVEESNH
ncbi:hypothetical protein AcV7_005472 [Taiwanofungus camphoratus]|nr:hypothetical protein AcV7_005472 [Antrodia cinnamomea]